MTCLNLQIPGNKQVDLYTCGEWKKRVTTIFNQATRRVINDNNKINYNKAVVLSNETADPCIIYPCYSSSHQPSTRKNQAQ